MKMNHSSPTHSHQSAIDTLIGLSDLPLLSKALEEVFVGRACVVSAFGAESALVLDLVARVNRHTPILFIDTGKHFQETLDYRDLLIDRFRLTRRRIGRSGIQPAICTNQMRMRAVISGKCALWIRL